jgi:hypothetical protein
VTGTVEYIYNKDVNGIYYINANLTESNAQFAGPDQRERWVGSNRVNSNITSAIVLKNQNVGYSWNLAGSLERPFQGGAYVKAAYSYGVSKNTIDPGSIAFGSWNNNQHAGDPNNPGVGFSSATAAGDWPPCRAATPTRRRSWSTTPPTRTRPRPSHCRACRHRTCRARSPASSGPSRARPTTTTSARRRPAPARGGRRRSTT